MAPAKVPLSTYRVQFNTAFSFVEATTLIPYWHGLGITDCYASPYFKAVPGSPHGYDVIDPTVLNPEVGTREEYETFVKALQASGMGQLLDVVPNHMGIGRMVNAWWADVLENGPSSPYSIFFDIDWDPVKRELHDKVLLPILGDLYGHVLENQQITLEYDEGTFCVRYYDHRLPLSPRSGAKVLAHRLDRLIQCVGRGHAPIEELQSIITGLRNLPPRHERDPDTVEERYREKTILRKRLAAVARDSAVVGAFIADNVALFNGTKGDPRSFDLLDDLLDDQVYRLAYWRVASEEINYRRFFDINELAAIRVEDPAVFQEVHGLVFRLLKDGAVTGLRIDHVDGLYSPSEYVTQLQAWARREMAPCEEKDRPLYLIVEKILGRDEPLPETWPVYGTTGYDFMNMVNGLFVDQSSERRMTDIYARFMHKRLVYQEVVYESKKLIMQAAMSSELNVLGHHLNRLSERDRRSRDFTLNSLTHAIREIVACFPVYRTYVMAGASGLLDRDRSFIRLAVARAKRRNPALSGLVFDFVRDLLLKQRDARTEEDEQLQQQFMMKFQQITSPVTAKGVEDTAFYIYNRLVSLNEVGGDPEQFGLSVETFHRHMQERQARWPLALSATSTHDTKRSEDVRARINVLSELPQEWRTHVLHWAKLNKRFKTEVEGDDAPDRNEEYLLYQTLIGAWPFEELDAMGFRMFQARIQQYLAKAIKEAKVHTSWVNPNPAHEEAVANFIDRILDRSTANLFLRDFLPFQQRIADYGIWNSLAQLVLKLTAPGVPDFYQGMELWNFSLVDPDNRRPVDFSARRRVLEDLQQGCAASSERTTLVRHLLDHRRDGRLKFYVLFSLLSYRRSRPELFSNGTYVPLELLGERTEQVCAFARLEQDQAVVAAVPRLVTRLCADANRPPVGPEIWSESWMTVPSWSARTHYRNLLTGETLTPSLMEGRHVLSLGEIFQELPVAVLERLT